MGFKPVDILHTVQMLYQLSYRGNSAGQTKSLNVIQGQKHLSSDKLSNSELSTEDYTVVVHN